MNITLSFAVLGALAAVVWWASRLTKPRPDDDWPLESDGIYDWANEELTA
jgi:hypothetical protein